MGTVKVTVTRIDTISPGSVFRRLRLYIDKKLSIESYGNAKSLKQIMHGHLDRVIQNINR
jgi:hypothetical protein